MVKMVDFVMCVIPQLKLMIKKNAKILCQNGIKGRNKIIPSYS